MAGLRASASGSAREVIESALNFGPSEELVAVLARPRATERPEADLAVAFLNSGILHRIGPNRIHVRLARTVATLGVPSLRMDLPGIGDSRILGTGASALDENLWAVRSALDLLERRGVARRFVLFGLCSGAADAFAAACADPRVVGLCLVDPPTLFPTWKSIANRVARWAARPQAWLRLFSGRYGVLDLIGRRVRSSLRRQPKTGRQEDAAPTPAASPAAVRPLVARALEGLIARRVRICYIITGDQRHAYNYPTQLLDSFPGIGLEEVVRLELFPGASHTFPRESSRALLEETLADWIATSPFPRPVVEEDGAGELAHREARTSA